MEKEKWKEIPGYEGHYQASNFGRIRSLKFNKVRILRPQRNRNGYYKVGLCLNNVSKESTVHRLVWFAFNGPIPEGLEINHRNEKKDDNSIANLELVTRKENVNYGTRAERVSKKLSKPVIQLDKNGNFIKEWTSSQEIQRQLGYLASHIIECCHNLKHSAYGFIWKHKENMNYGTAIARSAKKRSKSVIQFDKQGNFIKEWPSSSEIQRQLGYAASHIRECCRNVIPSAYGFIWKHKENPEIL